MKLYLFVSLLFLPLKHFKELLRKSEDTSYTRAERISFLKEAESFRTNDFVQDNFKIANRYWNLEEYKGYYRILRRLNNQKKKLSKIELLKLTEYQADYYALQTVGMDIQALNCYNQILNNELSNNRIKHIIYRKIASIFLKYDLAESQKYVLKCLKYFEESNDFNNYYKTKILLGISYTLQEMYDMAINEFLDILKNSKYLTPYENITLLNNIGRIYYDQGKLDLAKKYLNYANNQYINLDNDANLKFLIKKNLYFVNLGLGLTKSKKRYYELLRESEVLQNDPVDIRIGYYKYLLSEKKEKEAMKVLESALKVSTQTRDKILCLKLILLNKVDVHGYFSDYLKEVTNEKNKSSILIEKYLRNLQRQEEINVLSNKKLKHKKELVKYSMSIAILIIVLCTLIVWYYKRKSLKLKSLNFNISEELNMAWCQNEIEVQKNILLERERISREIHDDIMNNITALKFRLNMEFFSNSTNPYESDLIEIEKSLRSISNNLQNVNYGLDFENY